MSRFRPARSVSKIVKVVAGFHDRQSPPREIARHLNAKGFVQRVQLVRSAAGGMRRAMVKARVVPMTPGTGRLMTHVGYVAVDGAGVEGEQGQL